MEPRIVLLDIETLPNLQQALLVWPQLSNYPGQTLKASINSVICFGYKIFGESETHCISAWDFPEWNTNVNDDKPLLTEVLKILENAHAVVTHNGKSFDWRFIQTRLAIHDMPSLPRINHIDTKNESKRNLYLFSNSLKHVAEQLTDSRKIENEGWNLWVRTYNKDPEAMNLMSTYCKGDVDALEAAYKKLRKYSKDVPNHNMFDVGAGGKPVCSNCGSSRIVSEGIRCTSVRTYRRYCCKDCGCWTRTDLSDKFPRPV